MPRRLGIFIGGLMATNASDATINALSKDAQTNKATIYESLGGSSAHIVVNFHLVDSTDQVVDIPVYFGTAITISYSVYRSKQSVFNFGNNTIDGFAIGNKYVAGTLIKGVFNNDELNNTLATLKDSLILNFNPKELYDVRNNKMVHSIMKDDLLSCDINIIYTNEYTDHTKIEVIQDATFINNGQVASINDIITETTLSYVARSVKSMDDTDKGVSMSGSKSSIQSATDLLFGK